MPRGTPLFIMNERFEQTSHITAMSSGLPTPKLTQSLTVFVGRCYFITQKSEVNFFSAFDESIRTNYFIFLRLFHMDNINYES